MSNVIEFLEKMGQDALLRHATPAELDEALIRAGIEPALRAAVLDPDSTLLESLLGANHNIFCAVNVPHEEEEEEREDEEEGEDDEDDDEEDDDDK